jgi:NADH-quinone oxidoreductase subunit J
MALIGIACVYLYLDAEFLAIIQIMIYVGAIVTLFIFTIMLTADIKAGPFSQMIRRILVSAGASLAILFILIRVIVKTAWRDVVPCTDMVQGLPQLGISLMSKYVLPLEVISLILLAALVGTIVIGKADKR